MAVRMSVPRCMGRGSVTAHSTPRILSRCHTARGAYGRPSTFDLPGALTLPSLAASWRTRPARRGAAGRSGQPLTLAVSDSDPSSSSFDTADTASETAGDSKGLRAYRVPAAVSDGRALAVSGALFGLLSLDLAGPRLLADRLDMPVHTWVHAHLSLHDNLLWDKFSDVPIALGVLGTLGAWGAVLSKEEDVRARGSTAFGIALAMYFLTGGLLPHTDPLLVGWIKEFFHRHRPTDLLHSYSFPSGHTTAASFSASVLLWVQLPALLAGTSGGGREAGGAEAEAGDAEGWAGLTPSAAAQFAVWGGLTAATATGRVMADFHWMSDTMGGCCLGLALGSTCAIVADRVLAGKTTE